MEKMNLLFSLIRDFLISYLPKERKCSPHTIRSYQKALELLLDYIKVKNNVTLNKVTFEMINRNSLSEFLDYLETERGCGVTTRNHRLHCIRAFYTYAAESNITVIAHLEEISKVDTAIVAEKLVEHMSEAVVDIVISAPDTSTQKGLRDMFLMLFLFRTGARIQELLDVKLRDIRFGTSPCVTLYGKGSKARTVPLRSNTVEHLKSYINLFHQGESIYSEQFLFYVIRNQSKKRMTEDNARDLIHKYGVRARKICVEVPENVHPHLFRHSCAMSLYHSGVHLTLISQWLGHSKLETTLIYAHADTEIKRKAIENAIPEGTPLRAHTNAKRYKISDEDDLKRLCGLK